VDGVCPLQDPAELRSQGSTLANPWARLLRECGSALRKKAKGVTKGCGECAAKPRQGEAGGFVATPPFSTQCWYLQER